MTTLFAAALAVGGIGIIAWIVVTAASSTEEGTTRADPEGRWGRTARVLVAGVFGFGMAGLSATYAGWDVAASAVAALAGGAGLAWVSVLLGPHASG